MGLAGERGVVLMGRVSSRLTHLLPVSKLLVTSVRRDILGARSVPRLMRQPRRASRPLGIANLL